MISIITPFKDAELWLGRCLASMQKQVGSFQFIIVNDNSTDGGRQIAENYAKADSRFLVLDNEHTAGVSGARNTGLDYADGEYFTFLDADDELHEDAWVSFKKALSIESDMHQLNHLRHYATVNKTAMKYANPSGWYDAEHLPVFFCMVWNKLYDRNIYGKVRFIEGLQYGEDEIFNFDCFDISDELYSSSETGIIHHFDNAGSLSKTKGAKGLIQQNHALEDLLVRCKKQKVRKAVLDVIAEHWSSKTYNIEFVEKTPICGQ